ncbi:lipoyl(octanoyl) transferase LipB [Gordonia oryzae]|uniref:Octanoyltransferase n=1 Tax=Gordonia oryzae TaxID=2487349 RepID=A0A3N4GQ75_9ACTN|nr:lipoyl(octanoyl) transferase LipB [Gordonia oryzae]RPA63408.1 lipoyl(octanoyl) transferase LipB [Gordonia oryzae]
MDADRTAAVGTRRASLRAVDTPVEVRWLGVLDYREAYELQHRLAGERADGTLDHDVLLLLEHPSIYTAGKRTEDADRPTNGAEVIDVDRGGRITWHGPGQLVGYPIIKLAEPLDVVEYVRRLEAALIAVCATHGVATTRVAGRSGVWVVDESPELGQSAERKLGQIGIRVARGVALHGFALNVDPDMSAFDAIVPCGIADAGVTSLSREAGRELSVGTLADEVADAVLAALDHSEITLTPQAGHANGARVASVR